MPQIGPKSVETAMGTVQFTVVSPAGAETPARWQANPFEASTKAGTVQTSVRVKRNAAQTADQFYLNMAVPIVCPESAECSLGVKHKATITLMATIPDAASLANRQTISDLLLGFGALSSMREALAIGENFY